MQIGESLHFGQQALKVAKDTRMCWSVGYVPLAIKYVCDILGMIMTLGVGMLVMAQRVTAACICPSHQKLPAKSCLTDSRTDADQI